MKDRYVDPFDLMWAAMFASIFAEAARKFMEAYNESKSNKATDAG